MFGSLKTQLEAPVAYDPYLEERFVSVTSTCGAEDYSYTTPGPYALNTTTRSIPGTETASAPAAPSSDICVGDSVTVSEEDTFESIAAANSVSTYSLLSLNHLDIFCSDITPGNSMCLPARDMYYL